MRTALAEGLRELFKQLEERLSLRSPVNVYLAGGMAVHLYTATRVTTDVDAEFGGRVFLPKDLMVEVTLEDGTQQVVYLDNQRPGRLHRRSGDAEIESARCGRSSSRGRRRTDRGTAIDRSSSSGIAGRSGTHLLAARYRGRRGAWR